MHRRFLAALAPAALLPFLFSCGGSGSGDEMSSASIVFTDAAADEVETFEVDVENVVLTRASGADVSVLTRTTRIDFAQLDSLAELVAGVSVPAGDYTGVRMTLNFSNAMVTLVGQTTQATVLGSTGAVLTGVVSVQASLPSGLRPTFAVSRNHLVLLDLHLDQALAVDAAMNEVTFTPSLSFSFDPTNPKPIAMTGTLMDVNATAGTFTVQKRTPSGTPIGTYTVGTGSSTVFQIDGVVSTGTSGLTALAGSAGGTMQVWVQGVLSPIQRRLTAAAVETGTGTPGNGQDWLVGHVVGRDNGPGSDATLTVLGRSVDDPGGTVQINTTHTVTVSLSQTKVLRRAAGNSLTTDDINVGQRVMVFGTLTGTSLDATAATGVVRLLRTSLFGTATGAPAGNTVTLNVSRIDLRSISAFDFTVGGNSQATPTAMTVDATGLDTTGITTNTKTIATGWFGAVDDPGEDLTAVSLTKDAGQSPLLLCQWLPGRADALPSINNNGIALDVSTAAIKVVADGFAPTTLTTSPTPTVQSLIGVGIFTIVEQGALEVHLDFDSFVQSLATRVSSTSPVFRLSAIGPWTQGTQTMNAVVVTAVLQ